MKSFNTLTRRLLAGLLACSLLLGSAISLAGDKAYRGISVQLWSVKDDVTSDVKGTLKALADMGFDGVELAGNLGEFGDDTSAFKAYLDSLGLEISGAHVGFDKLTDENFDDTVAFYKSLGVEWLIIPADGRAWSDDGIKNIVEQLNATAKKLAPHGMRIGYHNHQAEFRAYGDTTYWEYMVDNTSDDVLIQLDASWSEFAEVDTVAIIKRYDDRILTSHIKAQVAGISDIEDTLKEKGITDFGQEMGIVFPYLNKITAEDNGLTSIVGQDKVNWQAIIDQYKQSPEPVWLVVEQEVYPPGMTPMQAVEASKKGLEKLL